MGDAKREILTASQQNASDTLEQSDDAPFAFIKTLVEASAGFVALAFIGGWSYLGSYYSAFGINPLELDIPLPIVCTSELYVLYSAKWPILVIIVLLLGWAILGSRFRRMPRRAAAATLGLLLLTAATAGVIQGRQRASEDQLDDSAALPYVAFAAKLQTFDKPPCVGSETYGSLDCKLLLHLNKTYYFFQPVPKMAEASAQFGNLNVYTLSDSEVIGVHIQRGLDRNGGF